MIDRRRFKTKKHLQNISKALKGKKLSLKHRKSISLHHHNIAGKNNPRYIDGRTLKKKRCLDCNKILAEYRAIRCSSCAKIQHLNSFWNNGSSKLPYSPDWTDKFKNLIKERDNYKCRKCNSKKDLIIHHIDRNKQNSNLNNLITLCRKCHSKQHKKKWITFGTSQ